MSDYIKWAEERDYHITKECCATCDNVEFDYEMCYCKRNNPHKWSVSESGKCKFWVSKKKEK